MATFLITFRETLEAALVVGIVLSYLSQLKAREWFRIVYWSVAVGILLSIFAGILFEATLGGFEGRSEELYEGIIMLSAGGLISWMILWMLKARSHIASDIRSKVDQHLMAGSKIGVFVLVLVSVLREGIETVLFLKASSLQTGVSTLMALLGIGIAILMGYLLFSGLRKFSLKSFFTITSVLLILFAAGLVAHGVHELQEAGVLSGEEHIIWDVNPALNPDGTYPALHEKGSLGSLAKGLFGWNGNPTRLELASYFIYLIFIVLASQYLSRKSTSSKI